MRTPAQIAGHPIHPMLVALPIGLWVFSLACDLISLRVDSNGALETTAFHAMVGGIIGALAAAVPGFIDLLSLREPPIRKTALIHMALNLTLVAIYVFNVWTRYEQAMPREISIGLSALGVAILGVSGWLGGKMVYGAGVAVHASAVPTSSDSRDGPVGAAGGLKPQRGGITPAFQDQRAMAAGSSGRSDRASSRDRAGRGDRDSSERPR